MSSSLRLSRDFCGLGDGGSDSGTDWSFLDPMRAVRSLQDIYLAFSILCQRANVLFSGSWQMTK
jgi:hypothetical protein